MKLRTREWIGLGVIACLAYLLLFRSGYSFLGFGQMPEPTEIVTCETMYSDCHPWDTVTQYAGMDTCFVGRISRVFSDDCEYPEPCESWWVAYFDPQAASTTREEVYRRTVGLNLISVDYDISKYEGQCVAVFGMVSEGDPEFELEPRTMIDADPDDGKVGFSIRQCPCE